MFSLIKLIFVTLLCIALIKADDVDQSLVDYYVELIQNRTKAAENYELPTDARMHEPENKTIEEYGEFDFIVIGAGSTGSIIASRLSEVKEWSVLLLEAGAFPDEDLTRIPALFLEDAQSKFNWGYQSVPQKNFCFGYANNVCGLARGKGIGGTSLINGLLYARANNLDYDNWSELLNDTSYRYENLLPYFLKTENFSHTDPDVPIDWEYHGTKGPLHMTQSILSSNTAKLQDSILLGIQQVGQPLTDYNGKQQLGVSVLQSYMENCFRDDPGLAFITRKMDRVNLRVLDNSYVMKLDISNENPRVNGVIFSRNNKTLIARNRKEVILSAGAFGSAQILMLSGVGPEGHLNSLGIPVIKNLPVGENLRDHVTVPLRLSSNFTFPNQTLEEQVRELLNGRGPLATVFGLNVVTYFKVPKGVLQNIPDIEMSFTNFQSNLPQSASTFDIRVEMFHPKSKGSLQLKSSDPFEYPLIDAKPLSDERDLEILYEGAQIVQKLTESEALRWLNVKFAFQEVEGCNQTEPFSKEYWFCYLERKATHANHFMSTCSTGRNDKTGVVDNNLRVYGVKDLRVADASIFPLPFAHHPTSTCAVIAEKISDQIKNEHNELKQTVNVN